MVKAPRSPSVPQRPGQWRRVDVRPLLAQGLEPCEAVLSAADSLLPGEGLEVVAPFLPSPLIERLKSEGFCSRVETSAAGAWRVTFWK